MTHKKQKENPLVKTTPFQCGYLKKLTKKSWLVLKEAQDTIDIQEQLIKIPVELHPVINQIASELSLTMGWATENFDFLTSTDPRAINFCRLAVVSLIELQNFCLDYWGTSLDDLIPNDDELEEVA